MENKEKFSISIAQFSRIVPMYIQAHGNMQMHILKGLIYHYIPQHLLGCNPFDAMGFFIGVTSRPLKSSQNPCVGSGLVHLSKL